MEDLIVKALQRMLDDPEIRALVMKYAHARAAHYEARASYLLARAEWLEGRSAERMMKVRLVEEAGK